MSDNIFLDLVSTPPEALLMGACIAVSALASMLAMGYYSIFRYPALLYFSCSVVLTHLIFAFASQDPTQLLQGGPLPAYFYFQQSAVLLGIFFYFKMISAIFSPHTKLPFLPRRAFAILAAALIAVKAFSMIYPNIVTIRAGSVLGILFLTHSALIAFTYPAVTAAMRLIKAGCALPAIAILIYPLIRLGVVPGEFIAGHMPTVLMAAIAFHSTLWFLGLVELARDAREKARTDSRQNMVRTILQLRDLIESPIDEIEESVAALSASRPISEVIKDMDSSISRLRLIKAILSRFGKNEVRRAGDDIA